VQVLHIVLIVAVVRMCRKGTGELLSRLTLPAVVFLRLLYDKRACPPSSVRPMDAYSKILSVLN
jgi:hypothetical protein